MDLITGGEVLPGGVGLADSQGDNVINEEVRPEERLEACHVKLIWNHSGLAKSRLKEIWCVIYLIGSKATRLCAVPLIGANLTRRIRGALIANNSFVGCGELTRT